MKTIWMRILIKIWSHATTLSLPILVPKRTQHKHYSIIDWYIAWCTFSLFHLFHSINAKPTKFSSQLIFQLNFLLLLEINQRLFKLYKRKKKNSFIFENINKLFKILNTKTHIFFFFLEFSYVKIGLFFFLKKKDFFFFFRLSRLCWVPIIVKFSSKDFARFSLRKSQKWGENHLKWKINFRKIVVYLSFDLKYCWKRLGEHKGQKERIIEKS